MRSWVPMVVVLLLAAGCTSAPADQELVENPVAPCGQLETIFEPDPAYNPTVRFETSNGTMELTVFLNQVPFTAGTFLKLVEDGFYDGTRFHRLVPGAFIQGGDPNTATDNKNFWGTGPGYTIRDEFHQFLRHDEPGTVAMASTRPHGGDSQFIVHLEPAPGLDDRTTVFAQVVDGLEVAEALARTPTDDRGRPVFEGRLIDAELVAPEKDRTSANVTLSAYGYDCVQAAEPGGTAEFLVATRNTGQRVLNGTFSFDAPQGWSTTVPSADRLVLASGKTVVYPVEVAVPDTAEPGTSENVTFTLVDPGSEERHDLTLQINVGPLGPRPSQGDRVEVHFLGVLDDGRPFDTTREAYTTDGSLTWFKPAPTASLSPLPFLVTADGLELAYEDLPAGLSKDFPVFNEVVNRTQLGGASIHFVAPGEAYQADAWGSSNLGGRSLVFQVEIVSLEPAA